MKETNLTSQQVFERMLPCRDDSDRAEQFAKLNEKWRELFTKLSKELTDEQRIMFETLLDVQLRQNDIVNRETYSTGFKNGAKMMFEMFIEDSKFGSSQARPVLDKSDYIDESSLPNKKLPTMLTIKEAAKQVPGFTEYQIRRLCKSGELPCVFAGRKMLINRDNLYKYLYGESVE